MQSTTERDLIKKLFSALGDTMPENGCRHIGPEELAACSRCQALREGKAYLDRPVEDQ